MRKKHPKSAKKIIILMTLALSILFLVNNTFAMVNSIFSNAVNIVEAKRIGASVYRREQEIMAQNLMKDLTPEFNEHIVHTYMGGEAEVYNKDGIRAGLTYIPTEDIEQYIDIDSDYVLNDNEILLSRYAYNDRHEVFERKEKDFVGREVSYTARSLKYVYDDNNKQTVEIADETKHTFRVKGLYDNAKAYQENVDGIISEDMLMQIFGESAVIQDENSNVSVGVRGRVLYVTIDDYENADMVADSIEAMVVEKYGQSIHMDKFEFGATDEFHSLDVTIMFVNILAAFLIVCTVLSIHSYIKDMMNRRKREFGIMKAIGYRTSGIGRLLVRELIPEIVIPLAVVLTLGIASVIIADSFFRSAFDFFTYSVMDFKLFPNILALVTAIDVLLPLAGHVVAIRKIEKLEPMEALR